MIIRSVDEMLEIMGDREDGGQEKTNRFIQRISWHLCYGHFVFTHVIPDECKQSFLETSL